MVKADNFLKAKTMKNIAGKVIVLSLLGLLCSCAARQQSLTRDRIYLWPDEQAPWAKGTDEKDKPAMMSFPTKGDNTGCTVIIFPGGGYGHLAMEHEGMQVAQWLNRLGVSAFVLDYRHYGKGYQNPAPLSDAQRAVRLVRYHAKEWAIDPNRIGIIGFSAGGHLASTAGTHFQSPAYEPQDETDQLSCRPDFMALIYPVITFEMPFTHRGSRDNLLGKNAPAEQIKLFSNHLQVTKDTPPTFLIHANDDETVPPENSILFYEALRKAGVPAEMHIFLKGSHGFGIRKGVGPAEGWINLYADWLKVSGFLNKE